MTHIRDDMICRRLSPSRGPRMPFGEGYCGCMMRLHIAMEGVDMHAFFARIMT